MDQCIQNLMISIIKNVQIQHTYNIHNYIIKLANYSCPNHDNDFPLLQLILNPQEATLSPTKGMKLGSIIPHSLRGFFKTREELDEYEKTWHIYIYQPTWNELKSKVSYARVEWSKVELGGRTRRQG